MSETDKSHLSKADSDSTPSPSHDSGVDEAISPSGSKNSSKDEPTTAGSGDDVERLAPVSSGPPYSVFSRRTKVWIVAMVMVSSFVSPMTASIYFPAIHAIARDLGVSIDLINLTLTTYMVLQGIAPALFGDFGDMAGRRPAFIVAFSIYVFANIGLALQDNYAALLVLRMLQSAGSSGTLALSFAVVADISVSAERGKYMGFVGAGVNTAPALSPVLGGILAEYLGWRAIFWFCFILTGLWMIPYVLSVPETSRNVVGNGSIPPQGLNMTLVDYIRRRKRPRKDEKPRKRRMRFPNPLRTLSIVFEKDLALLLVFNAVLYLVFILSVATLSPIFADIYGLSDLQLGLCYLPYGIGCCVAAIAQGYILDWNYRRTARKIGFRIDYKRGDDLSRFPIERARIQPVVPFLCVGLLANIGYGWALHYRAPLAVPLALIFLIGLTVTGSFGIVQTLIVDLNPQAPATAVAAVNLVRCLCGAAVMAFIERMLESMGRGWCFTFWALLCAALAPSLAIVEKHGPSWREERRLRTPERPAETDGES